MNTNLTVSSGDFESIPKYYNDPGSRLNWELVFTLPGWLQVWWENFGSGTQLYLRVVRQQEQVIGIAPLQIGTGAASIIGSIDVCDYQDCIVAAGHEKDFYVAILEDLKQNGILELNFEPVRNDSTIAKYLLPLLQEKPVQMSSRQVDVSMDMDLPETWEEYLTSLDRKQRHELRRKMRNLQDIGETNYRVIEEKAAIPETIDKFLKLFPESRGDKALFMTGKMQKYFHSLAIALAEYGVIKFGVLEFGQKPLAMVMYFDYHDNIYLYNSAYDPDYRSLSVGLISKIHCIKNSIERKKRRFDFLKGEEQYKHYLGGKELPLFNCRITL
jgi:CelD/BcsL family acetyltransferase involved in cellulose biosynthesis